ncbi:uncharacterized protein LOC122275671 [Carya illinoinensis]|uniref:Uncharacterized protein n=1 Tax=Carya illinoinensis TaxID=32201 RepID=A0A8T1PMT3_CARIL|nr:uncharacterized protein LOC122275671 [Carya illinoinensis]XP_042940758.1 uncharacterized protein LOC122275671 [Carya illinoinensis]KAG6641690.1 hypothetical protein CIPAW_09G092000 [Carya illinoinensis]
MSTCSNAQSTEVGHVGCHNAFPDSESHQSSLKTEEDEDEDVDFNPFLKETPSPEASSSLSSEIDGLNGNVFDIGGKIVDNGEGNNPSKPTSEVQNYVIGAFEHGEEETLMLATVSPEGVCERELQNSVAQNPKKRKSALNSPLKTGTVQTKENDTGADSNDVMIEELSNTQYSQKPISDSENEDAICTRTRARYSLASFSLDELETFLQETDDDDDLQNVDDELEYRKFLAAVLHGGDGDGQSNQENENVDDEDEDNDADFEIELEELLESDVDECNREKAQKECNGTGRRPETRQNRRQKDSAQYQKKLSGQAKRPLRPLLPVLPNGPIAPFPITDGKTSTPDSCTAEDGFIRGFTPHQVGQLHCLIHEHVQLLVQVFSLCVLDSSRQHIASQVRGLIFEILQKRNEVLAWKNVPYPSICFYPPYVCSSVPEELPKIAPAQYTLESCATFNAQKASSNQMAASQNMSPSNGRCEYVSNGHVGSFQNNEGFSWVPFMSGLVLSILDVAPLNLAGRYMDDVYTAVQDYRQRQVKSGSDAPFVREPLFPFPCFPSYPEANCEVLRGPTIASAVKTVPISPIQQPPKKTLAAALVESTKRQSVALVPKEISKLAQRFFPLFNPSLFPHKPPPAAVVNRVLFTDAEDELLALGLMEYNTDWKAIQQRFLPCKSKNQIFVRQKNRCSSKAPENPIKAVRRMKTSPLTVEEIACIQEGLKLYKLDWMSVWRFVVPHRDPSLLPRQWRIALGTQKSYKQDAAKKEKRRLYEARRRKCKTADLPSWQTVSEKEDNQAENTGGENNSGDDSIDNAGETHVHQASIADWGPGTFSLISSANPCSNLKEKILPKDRLPQEGTTTGKQLNYNGSREVQPQTGIMHKFPPLSQHTQRPYSSCQVTSARNCASNTMEPNHPASFMTSNSSKSPFCLRPYRARRNSSATNSRIVKLAPDLPPVNLPRSVRIVSQTDFKGCQFGASTKVFAAGVGIGNSGIEDVVSCNPRAVKLGTPHLVKSRRNESSPLQDNVLHSHAEESEVVKDKCLLDERRSDSDIQMHPLPFQAPEDGHLLHYPSNCGTSTSASFSFFSGNRPQLNINHVHDPQLENYVQCFNKSLKSKDFTSVTSGIDFQQLLQRTDDVCTDSAATCSTAHLSTGLDGKSGPSGRLQSPFDSLQTESLVSHGLAPGPNPVSPTEKANELDLEIHLSYTSRKGEGVESSDVTAHNPAMSVIAAATTRTQNISYPPCSTVSTNLISGGHGLTIPSNNISRYNVDDIGDQSHPEIVMEQEELSDSDEETEEHVEFECEEMADSEGEDGSGCEQIVEMQNKDGKNLTVENQVTVPSGGDNQCEPMTCCHPQGDVCVLVKDITPSLELGLSNQGKDDTSNSSWLSLDSCAPDRFLNSNTKHEERAIGEGPATENLSSCRPIRSCNKKKPSTKVTVQKHAMDMARQLSLGPLAISTLKKPRKRAYRTNTSLNVRLPFGSSSSDGKDRLD